MDDLDPAFVVGSTVLPFGKHKGKRILDVDMGYLLWMNGRFSDGRPIVAEAARRVQDELHLAGKPDEMGEALSTRVN